MQGTIHRHHKSPKCPDHLTSRARWNSRMINRFPLNQLATAIPRLLTHRLLNSLNPTFQIVLRRDAIPVSAHSFCGGREHDLECCRCRIRVQPFLTTGAHPGFAFSGKCVSVDPQQLVALWSFTSLNSNFLNL